MNWFGENTRAVACTSRVRRVCNSAQRNKSQSNEPIRCQLINKRTNHNVTHMETQNKAGKSQFPIWRIQATCGSVREIHPLNRSSTAWYAGHQIFGWFMDLVSIVCARNACTTKRARGDLGSKDVQLAKEKMLFHSLDRMFQRTISKFKFN